MLFIAGGNALAARTLASTTSQIIDLIDYDKVALTLNYANATGAAKTFVVASQPLDTLTVTAHGWVTGLKGQASTTGGLPTGLSTSTDYFVIVVDANTIKLADSLVHAVAGTQLDITSAGTGVQTFTPTTSAGNVIKAQASADGVTFTDITVATFPAIGVACTVTVATSTGAVTWDLLEPGFRYLNILYTPSAGQITFSVAITAKAYK